MLSAIPVEALSSIPSTEPPTEIQQEATPPEPSQPTPKPPLRFRCVDASDSTEPCVNHFQSEVDTPVHIFYKEMLVESQIYNAVDYDEEFVMLEGMTDRWWCRGRFEDVVAIKQQASLPVQDINLVFQAGPNEVNVVAANEQAVEEIPCIAAAAV